MPKVVSIDSFRNEHRRSRQQSTLCREGHHKWKVVKEKQFDVKRGKLVTAYRCERCGKEKTAAH